MRAISMPSVSSWLRKASVSVLMSIRKLLMS
jgi:hypothetical protein